MAAKKKHKKNKPRGHYCKVCGERKANEKFSGSGHAAHICKKCAAIPAAERNKRMTINRIYGMAFRRLSEAEIKWLRDRMEDSCPRIREAACEAHKMKFPRYERNMIKKNLTAFSLELFIHGDVWGEWVGRTDVHMLVSLNRTGRVHLIDYDAPESEREAEVVIGEKEARALLKSVIHGYDALYWDEDFSDAPESDFDQYLDVLDECYEDSDEDYFDIDDIYADEAPGPEPLDVDRAPLWSLSLELNNGEEKKVTFYNRMHDAPMELFWELMDFFGADVD